MGQKNWRNATWVWIGNLPKHLDWVLKIVESTLVIAISGLVFYFGWKLVREGKSEEIETFFKSIGENWGAMVLLLIPLFFRTVRTFLEEVHEAFGMKRPRRDGSDGKIEEDQKKNPPKNPKPPDIKF
ncbi:MAG: hypothetical protein NUW37_18035 [Planctomycetes bacterium]|nr:hypothetical protein [Planctomycetota bacterium]